MGGRRKGYGQYCPIARVAEVLGERWTILIVRDLLLGTNRFNDLSRGLPGLSRSLLSKRLRQLQGAGVVERVDGRYLLTEAGRELEPIVFGMGTWGARWAFDDPREEELDAELLVWWMHSRIDRAQLPDRRVVLHIEFSDDPRRFWIVIEPERASVCLTDPMFDVDVTLRSDTRTMYRVWLGKRAMAAAMKAGSVSFAGPSAMRRSMIAALRLSPSADVVSTAPAGR